MWQDAAPISIHQRLISVLKLLLQEQEQQELNAHIFWGPDIQFFSRQEVYSNNSVTLESINEVGVLAHTLLQTQLNASDKIGLTSCMGFNTEGGWNCLGHRINGSASAPSAFVFEYALPLIGILGSGSDKMIPVGNLFGLRLELTMDAYANFTVSKTGGAVTGCTISEFEFVGNYVELDSAPQSIIEAQNPQKIYIRSQSYRTATNTLAGGTSGLNDVLIGTRVSSLKSLFVTCSPSNALEKKFGSVCPNLGQGTCLVAAGMQIPQRTLNPANHPADCFVELQKSIGGLAMVNYNGAINRDMYYKSSTATGLMYICISLTNEASCNIAGDGPTQWNLFVKSGIIITTNQKEKIFYGMLNKGGGDCFYYSILQLVDLSEFNIFTVSNLRYAIWYFIKHHQTEICQEIYNQFRSNYDDESYNVFVDSICRQGQWACSRTIIITSLFLQRDIVVVTNDISAPSLFKTTTAFTDRLLIPSNLIISSKDTEIYIYHHLHNKPLEPSQVFQLNHFCALKERTRRSNDYVVAFDTYSIEKVTIVNNNTITQEKPQKKKKKQKKKDRFDFKNQKTTIKIN